MVTPLKAKHISKSYGIEQVLSDLSLELRSGETLSILGRSGSGKTTLLKVLAGLELVDSGSVISRGEPIEKLTPQKRNVVYLYQETLLFPHLDLFENIAFGLRLRDIEKGEVKRRTNMMIERIGLGGMERKMPHQLSGGQKQRVSFGRALITNPHVLLLDEPFGNLDADTRSSMQQLYKQMAREFNITALFVTHNVKEAILMGDRFGHLSNGSLKLFETIETFVASGHAGVHEELEFWQSLIRQSNHPKT